MVQNWPTVHQPVLSSSWRQPSHLPDSKIKRTVSSGWQNHRAGVVGDTFELTAKKTKTKKNNQQNKLCSVVKRPRWDKSELPMITQKGSCAQACPGQNFSPAAHPWDPLGVIRCSSLLLKSLCTCTSTTSFCFTNCQGIFPQVFIRVCKMSSGQPKYHGWNGS